MNSVALICASALLGLLPSYSNSSSSNVLDLSSSSCAEDLSALFSSKADGGDWYSYCRPRSSVRRGAEGDLYDQFRFVTAVHDGSDVYFYVYLKDLSDYLEKGFALSFSYDLSTAIGDDGFSDDYSLSVSPSIVSNSGSCFWKLKASSLITGSDTSHRLAVGDMTLSYSGLDLSFGCEGFSYAWTDGDRSSDISLQDNYVVVKDSIAGVEIVPQEYASLDSGELVKADERHWLFFDYDDSTLGNFASADVVGARVIYDYSSFDYQYSTPWVHGSCSLVFNRSDGRSYEGDTTLYTGMLNDSQGFSDWYSENVRLYDGYKMTASAATLPSGFGVCGDVSVEKDVVSEVEHKTVTYSGDIGSVAWYEWLSSVFKGVPTVSYSYDTLQKLDDSSVNDSSYSVDHVSFLKYFRDFGGSSRKYALCFKDDVRSLSQFDSGHAFYSTSWTHTSCHEATNIRLLSLTFNNGFGTADFSALMDPVDETFVAVTDPDVYVPVSIETKVTDPSFWGCIGVCAGASCVVLCCLAYTVWGLKVDLAVSSVAKKKGGRHGRR
jgi:hypothetical protein